MKLHILLLLAIMLASNYVVAKTSPEISELTASTKQKYLDGSVIIC